MSSQGVSTPKGDRAGRVASQSSSQLKGHGNRDEPIILDDTDDEMTGAVPVGSTANHDSDFTDDDLPADSRITPRGRNIGASANGVAASQSTKHIKSSQSTPTARNYGGAAPSTSQGRLARKSESSKSQLRPRPQQSSSQTDPIDLTFSESNDDAVPLVPQPAPTPKSTSAPKSKKAWFAKKTMAPGAAARISKAAAKHAESEATLKRKRSSTSPAIASPEASKRAREEDAVNSGASSASPLRPAGGPGPKWAVSGSQSTPVPKVAAPEAVRASPSPSTSPGPEMVKAKRPSTPPSPLKVADAPVGVSNSSTIHLDSGIVKLGVVTSTEKCGLGLASSVSTSEAERMIAEDLPPAENVPAASSILPAASTVMDAGSPPPSANDIGNDDAIKESMSAVLAETVEEDPMEIDFAMPTADATNDQLLDPQETVQKEGVAPEPSKASSPPIVPSSTLNARTELDAVPNASCAHAPEVSASQILTPSRGNDLAEPLLLRTAAVAPTVSSEPTVGEGGSSVFEFPAAGSSTLLPSGSSRMSPAIAEKGTADSRSILAKCLGGLTPSQFMAQRTAEKLLRRQQDSRKMAEKETACQAALVVAELEVEAGKGAVSELEDVQTESDVSSFLEDSTSKSTGPGTPSWNSVGMTGDYPYHPSRSQSCDDSAGPTRKFDTRLQDMINAIPESERNYALLKSIFEAYIAENTCVDEPNASEITIVNTEDREPKPPPFEFQYSNQVFYAPGVEPPVASAGCGCFGPCDPESDTCLCVLRQTAYLYNSTSKGFAYADGKLRPLMDVSIWECSDACGCPTECGNRVIQRGRDENTHVQLFKTRHKGWGVRNGSDRPILPGTFIGVYSGELLPEDESEHRAHAYNKVGRTYLFDLDGYQIANPPAGLEKIDPETAKLAYKAQRDALEWAQANVEPSETGELSLEGYSKHSVDAFHWGPSLIDLDRTLLASLFNHSCDPNLATVQAYVKDFHPERPILALFARRKILGHEELCISYHGVDDEEEDAAKLPTPGKKGKGRAQSAHVAAPKGGRSRAAEAERALSIKDECRCESRNCTGYLFKIHKTK